MRIRMIVAALLALLSSHALAFDASKANRYPSPDMYRPNVDSIILRGNDSSGPADKFSVTPNSNAAAGTLSKLLADRLTNDAVLPNLSAAPGTLARILSTRIPGLRPSLADITSKVQAGTPTTICAQGDSLTYGTDSTATGTLPPINNGYGTRSSTPYPESLSASIAQAGIGSVNVINRGYPGDSSAQGVTRWANASACDLTILMYGHNDANNYGGNGPQTVAQFRANMVTMIDRALAQGSAVVLMTPPPAADFSQNRAIQPYATEARRLGAQYGLYVFDAAEQLAGISSSIWTDGVHLTQTAYRDLGWQLATVILRRGETVQRVGPGTILYPQTMPALGGTLLAAGQSRNGYFIQVNAGEIVTLPLYVESDVLPVLSTYNNSGSYQQLTTHYAADQAAVFPVTAGNNGTSSQRASATLFPISRGHRILTIRNEGSGTIFIENVRFVSPASAPAQTTPTRSVRRASVAGLSSPRAGLTSGFWSAGDYGNFLNAGGTISAYMALDANTLNGIAILKDRGQGVDYLAGQQIIIGRLGTSLVVRQLNGGNVTDSTFTGVFGAGTQTGKLEVSTTATSITVYWNGTNVGTVNNPFMISGFPGIVSDGPSDLACMTMAVSD